MEQDSLALHPTPPEFSAAVKLRNNMHAWDQKVADIHLRSWGYNSQYPWGDIHSSVLTDLVILNPASHPIHIQDFLRPRVQGPGKVVFNKSKYSRTVLPAQHANPIRIFTLPTTHA